MPKPPLPRALDEFLSQPIPAVIATLQRSGAPHTAATWYLWESGRVLVNMDESRKRLEHLRGDPRVSITVLGGEEWYRHVTIVGQAVSISPDLELEDIDRLARHYTGNPFERRDQRRFSAWIDVEWWHAWAGVHAWTGA